MKRLEKCWRYIIFVVMIAVDVVLVAKNCRNEDFYVANIIQIITITITVIVSFYLVQKMIVKRRQADCIERILNDFYTILCSEEPFRCNSKKSGLLRKSMKNKLLHLKNNAICDITEDIDYIYREYTELIELYDNHSQNDDEIKSIELDIERYRINISDKLDKIRLVLNSI